MITISRMINELSNLIGANGVDELDQKFIKEIAFRTDDGMRLDELEQPEIAKLKLLWTRKFLLKK